MLGKLSIFLDFLRLRPGHISGTAQSQPNDSEGGSPEKAASTEARPAQGPLPIESPFIRRRLKDAFTGESWSYIKELLMREIILYQTRVDRALQGSIADPRDTNASLVRYHGGRIRGAEEIKLIIERLKKNFG